jgi:septum formation protein
MLTLLGSSPLQASLLRRLGIPFQLKPYQEPTIIITLNQNILDFPFPSLPRALEVEQHLKALEGKKHTWVTSGFIESKEKTVPVYEKTELSIGFFAPKDLQSYIASEQGVGHLGGLNLSSIGSLWIEQINGSWDNACGLPLNVLYPILKTMGLALSLNTPM